MNVKEENISSILESLPALKKPTISNLSESGWFSVSTIIDKSEFIKKSFHYCGREAQGLVVSEPRQILQARRDQY